MMLFPPLCGSVSSVDTCINGSTVSGPSSILLPCFPSRLVLLHFCWPVDPASPRSANPFRRPCLFKFHFCPRDFLSCVVLSVKLVWPQRDKNSTLSDLFQSCFLQDVRTVSTWCLWSSFGMSLESYSFLNSPVFPLLFLSSLHCICSWAKLRNF